LHLRPPFAAPPRRSKRTSSPEDEHEGKPSTEGPTVGVDEDKEVAVNGLTSCKVLNPLFITTRPIEERPSGSLEDAGNAEDDNPLPPPRCDVVEENDSNSSGPKDDDGDGGE